MRVHYSILKKRPGTNLQYPIELDGGSDGVTEVISIPMFPIRNGMELLIAVKVSGVTGASPSTVSLHTGNFVDSQLKTVDPWRGTADKTASISTNGMVEILIHPHNSSDIGKLPLGIYGKVSIDVPSGSTVTVEDIILTEVRTGPG